MNIEMNQKKEYVAPEMSVLEFRRGADLLLVGSDSVEEASEEGVIYRGELE